MIIGRVTPHRKGLTHGIPCLGTYQREYGRLRSRRTMEENRSREIRRLLPAGDGGAAGSRAGGQLRTERPIVGDLHHLEEAGSYREGKPGMSIRSASEEVILVDLPRELEKQDELQTVIEMLRDSGNRDVVIDFSDVDVVGGACLTSLLEVRGLLNDSGHKLTLCGVAPATKGIFTVVRLEPLFEFAENRFSTLVSLQMIG
jgi:anti-anti-sigma regulatory factor